MNITVFGAGAWGTAVAPANMKGVRMLLRALHRGETIALVPQDGTPAAIAAELERWVK